ncbi:MAG TPA: hypothetical protein VGQ76_13130 [Thermoanaerobaculia bacterium]|jgi:hypothetical protein|nr:hypothetical protein [Thermoanaerobaculia bacterium]
MGLFKNVFGGSEFPSNEPEAILGILMSIIAADGDISQEEADSFMYLANRTKSLGPMPAQPFWAHVETCKGILRRNGPHVLMDKCAPMISQARREPLFVNSCDLIMRDGRVEPEEEELIEGLQARLSIDGVFAQNTIAFILTKYSL